jgi:hypothetical protein
MLLRLKKRAADKRETKLIRDEEDGDDVEAAVGRIVDIDDKNDVDEKQASSRVQDKQGRKGWPDGSRHRRGVRPNHGRERRDLIRPVGV